MNTKYDPSVSAKAALGALCVVLVAALMVLLCSLSVRVGMQVAQACTRKDRNSENALWEEREGFVTVGEETDHYKKVSGRVAPKTLNETGQNLVRSYIDEHNAAQQKCVQFGITMPAVMRPASGYPSNVCSVPLAHPKVANVCDDTNESIFMPDIVERVALDGRHRRCNIFFKDQDDGDSSSGKAREYASGIFQEDDGLPYVAVRGYMGNNMDHMQQGEKYLEGRSTNFRNVSLATAGEISTKSSENFTIEWKGFFQANTEGFHVFHLRSDSLAFLWFGKAAKDGRPREENALIRIQHPEDQQGMPQDERRARVELSKDVRYPIRIRYSVPGDSPSDRAFSVSYEVPGGGALRREGRMYDGRGSYFPSVAYSDKDLSEAEIQEIDGLRFEVYKGTFFDSNAKFFSGKTPTHTGYTHELGSLGDLTGNKVNSSTTEVTVQWTGYMQPRKTGFHVFFLESGDNPCYLWIGKNALEEDRDGNSLNTGRAVLTGMGAGGWDNMRKAEVHLTADGRRYPVRMQYGIPKGSRAGGTGVKLQFTEPETRGKRTSDAKSLFFPSPGQAPVEVRQLRVKGLRYVLFRGATDVEGDEDLLDAYDADRVGRVTDLGSVAAGTEFNVKDTDTDYVVQWVGYFQPTRTGYHKFFLTSRHICYMWIGRHAVLGNTSAGNAFLRGQGSMSTTDEGIAHLQEDKSYPLRLSFVKRAEQGGGGMRFGYSIPLRGNEGRTISSERIFDGNRHYFSIASGRVYSGTVSRIFPGPYLESCRNVKVTRAYISAECKDGSGRYAAPSAVAVRTDGKGCMQCETLRPQDDTPPATDNAPPGSFRGSCTDFVVTDGLIKARCGRQDKEGRKMSDVNLVNNNGQLGCKASCGWDDGDGGGDDSPAIAEFFNEPDYQGDRVLAIKSTGEYDRQALDKVEGSWRAGITPLKSLRVRGKHRVTLYDNDFTKRELGSYEESRNQLDGPDNYQFVDMIVIE